MNETVVAQEGGNGVGLGIAGQATFLGAWLVAVVTALSESGLALLAVVGGVTALVLTIISLFRMRARLGGLATAAAWVLIGGVAGALVLFALIPGEREWGKLGAFIIALGVLATGIAVGHLLLALALMQRAARGLGGAATACQGMVLVAAGMTVGGGEVVFGYLALGAAVAGHVLLLLALPRLRAAPSGA
jgi:hypothetical protein